MKPKITSSSINNNNKKNFGSNVKKSSTGINNNSINKKNYTSSTGNDINDKIKRVQNLLNQASGK